MPEKDVYSQLAPPSNSLPFSAEEFAAAAFNFHHHQQQQQQHHQQQQINALAAHHHHQLHQQHHQLGPSHPPPSAPTTHDNRYFWDTAPRLSSQPLFTGAPTPVVGNEPHFSG